MKSGNKNSKIVSYVDMLKIKIKQKKNNFGKKTYRAFSELSV